MKTDKNQADPFLKIMIKKGKNQADHFDKEKKKKRNINQADHHIHPKILFKCDIEPPHL